MSFRDRACFSNCKILQIGIKFNPENNELISGYFNCPKLDEPREFDSDQLGAAEKAHLVLISIARAALPKELKCSKCEFRYNINQ